MKKEDMRQKSAKIALFGTIRVMVIAALFTAISIVLGKYLAINIGESIRLSFENLSILLAGICFGPVIGGVVGMAADMVGCFMVGYAINPVITLGAALIGVISGVFSRFIFRSAEKFATPFVFIPVMLSHIICSMGIKTLGMALYYGTPFEILILRVPIYIAVGLLESILIMSLFKNKNFSSLIYKIQNKRR